MTTENRGNSEQKDRMFLYAMFVNGDTPSYICKLTDMPRDYVEKHYETWQRLQRKYRSALKEK